MILLKPLHNIRLLIIAIIIFYFQSSSLVYGAPKASEVIKTTNVISALRTSSNGSSTRIVFELSSVGNTELSLLNQPARLVLDMPMLYGWTIPNDNKLANTIRGVRYGRYNDKNFRIVFDLNTDSTLEKAFMLPPSNETPNYRLVIDIKTAGGIGIIPTNKIVILTPENTPKEVPTAPLNNTPSNNNQRDIDRVVSSNKTKVPKDDNIVLASSTNSVVVVIDPGHGGKDPGATVGDVMEKNITISVSSLIRQELIKNPEITVFLTRSGDYFIPLQDRTKFAKNKKADLFVSIHADKTSNVKANGLSVYTLSDKASDREAELLAKSENGIAVLSGVNFSKEDADVSNILINLVQRETMNQSARVANSILANVKQTTNILENPHRSAGFVVLKTPDIPSVLVEVGFLSNKNDLMLLQDVNYHKKLAVSMSESIESYLWTTGKLKEQPNSVKRAKRKQYAYMSQSGILL